MPCVAGLFVLSWGHVVRNRHRCVDWVPVDRGRIRDLGDRKRAVTEERGIMRSMKYIYIGYIICLLALFLAALYATRG